MKVLYVDAFSGVSGDKMVAALLSLGFDKSVLINELKKLLISGEFDIEIKDKNVMGITSKKFDVILKKHSHHHRGLGDIEKIIDDSSISENAKVISKDIFKIVAEAEAKVHDVPINEIHFHEVGAIDSIVDIVSVGILIDQLKPERIYSSKIALGTGFVEAAHGRLPVPAPATAEILKGVPAYQTEITTELTTPTGAAIIKYLTDEFVNMPEMTVEEIGYGAGTKDLSIPNVLRIFLGELESDNVEKDTIISLETNIDDSTPEQLGFLSEKLFENGALDVFITPLVMKKGRQGQLLTVLCNATDIKKFEEIIFLNSSTFGIRKSVYERSILKRETKVINVEGTEVKVKLGYYKGKLIQSVPEYESVKEGANKNGMPYNEFLKKIKKEPLFS